MMAQQLYMRIILYYILPFVANFRSHRLCIRLILFVDISQVLHGPSDANEAFVFALKQGAGPNLTNNLSEEDEFKYNTDPPFWINC